jgi:putative transposase
MQTYAALWVHLVWATKYRQPLITKKLKYSLYDEIRKICREKGYYLDFINGVEDHVHLLISLAPKFSVSEVVKNIKGCSQKWVIQSQLIDEYFEWQDGYAVISVSPSNLPKVRNYIKNQEIKHQNEKLSLEEEIENFKKMIIIPTP